MILSGCSGEAPPDAANPAGLELVRGAFLPTSSVADLRSSPLPPASNRALWEPLSVTPDQGWWFVGRGWQPLGLRSTLQLWRRSGGGSALILDVDQEREWATPFAIAVLVNGEKLETLTTQAGRQRFRVALPAGSVRELNEVEFRFDPPAVSIAGELPLSLLRIGLVGGGAGTAPQAGSRGSVSPESLPLSGPGRFVLPCDVPFGARELEIELTGSEVVPGTMRVLAFTETDMVELGSFRLAARRPGSQRVPVAEVAGQRIVLVLEIEQPPASPGANGLQLDRLEFLPDEVQPASETVGLEPGWAPVTVARPDVVLIILDAARGDRFPGWNYPRPLLPNISRLAESALSFRHAFAECPTTSCSIPALISGRGFLPGGEVGGGLPLSDTVVTLAEHLRELGYRTVGFSATPNNSASRNHAQGFDRFEELWGRDNPNHGPFAMSRLASEVVAAQPEGRPLFLQLHYLPPHQPYAPGEAYDRFTDPAYAGPIRPQMSLKPYSLGMERLDGADLEHLVGLYDGNLLLADAAVGQLLTALERAERFENSVIVITSDHGEAFMEHGRQGHNTTLFDEMLHIPLLIRLPGGEVPAVDTHRLASELDIVPTLLGRLGVTAAGDFDGIDLLGEPAEPLRPRRLFLRTSHPEQPILGVRSPRWKLISWPQHRVQMLFDLATDAGEDRNLVGEAPERFAGLALALRHHLEMAPADLVGVDEIELTEEESATLRALGYLD